MVRPLVSILERQSVLLVLVSISISKWSDEQRHCAMSSCHWAQRINALIGCDYDEMEDCRYNIPDTLEYSIVSQH
jgi:hypothetical protein